MFTKREIKELKREIKEIKEALVGVDIWSNSYKNPASYSALAAINRIKKEQQNTYKIIYLLLDKLGFSIEEGMRIEKKRRKTRSK